MDVTVALRPSRSVRGDKLALPTQPRWLSAYDADAVDLARKPAATSLAVAHRHLRLEAAP